MVVWADPTGVTARQGQLALRLARTASPQTPRSPQALGVHGQVRISASPINCPSSIPASRAPAQRPWGSSVTSPTVCCPHGHPLFVPLAGQASVASLLLFVHTKLEDSEEGFIRRVLGATGL